jgi:hypothetical protein
VVGVPGSEGEEEPPPQEKSVIVVTLNKASRLRYFFVMIGIFLFISLR